jgi:hypothetical protein
MQEVTEEVRVKAQLRVRHKVSSMPKMKVSIKGKLQQFDISALTAKQMLKKRSGKDLWALLRPRIKLLITMRRDWGTLSHIYGHCDSDYGQLPFPWYIINSDGDFSTCWDLTQVVFLIYVALSVPTRVCFDVDIRVGSAKWVFDTDVDLYFIVDLVLNFFMSYTTAAGMYEVRHHVIVKHYLETWFAIDLVSSFPTQYIMMIAKQSHTEETGDNLRVIKTLRLLRLTKMLRLARIRRILQKHDTLDFVPSSNVMLLVFFTVFLAHMLSCFWYLIGTSDSHFHQGYYQPGWVLTEYCTGCTERNTAWWDNPGGARLPLCETLRANSTACQLAQRCEWSSDQQLCVPRRACVVGCEVDASVTLGQRYFASLCYVFNALEPGVSVTDSEKKFAMLAYVTTLMIDGVVVGVFSSALMTMGGKKRAVQEKLSATKKWMVEQRIPKHRQNSVLEYFRRVYNSRIMYQESEILSSMPPAMRMEFSTHLYQKFLSQVPLFKGLPAGLIHSLCSIVRLGLTRYRLGCSFVRLCDTCNYCPPQIEPMLAVRGQVIFAEGTTGKEMYFLLSGELEITANRERLGFVR